MSKYNSGGRLTPAQKKTKPFVDEIYANYLDRHPEGEAGADEAIKSYLHTMILSVSRSMSTLGDPDYKRAFNLLENEDRGQFYKEMFSIGGERATYFEPRSLPCCLIKDSYDGDFSKIEQGGFAGEILLSISKANKEDSPRSVALAEEWGINDRIANNLYEREIHITMASQMALSSIETLNSPDKLFIQEGRKVFKQVVPIVSGLIQEQLKRNNIDINKVSRFWIHQANLSMNQLIARKLLGRDPTAKEMPIILNEYANTSSAGSIIAFHKNHDDLEENDIGVICSFGAGYSVGSIIVQKI